MKRGPPGPVFYFRALDHASQPCADLDEFAKTEDFIEVVGWIVREDERYVYVANGTCSETLDLTKLLKGTITVKRRLSG